MVIDEDLIKDGITGEIICELIARHEAGNTRLKRLMDYYLGRHEILGRERTNDKIANNRIICNHVKYIVDMIKSYLVGNPVSYACSDIYDISALKNCYTDQDIESIDGAIEKEMSIYGKAYELVYVDENSQPKSTMLSPMNTFIVYECRVGEVPMFGVHYYKKYDIRGEVCGVCCIVCDKHTIYTFESDADSFTNLKLSGTALHYFGEVPFIEYRNNEEEQGDFEQLISLIDAYNLLMSDRVNDKEQFVDSFLFLTGIELDGEQAKKLRAERILMGYEGATAEYLSKVMSENDIQVLQNNIRQDIHRFSMVPDLSEENLGNNLSGVAIKYRLMGFEQHVRNKERYFAKALKKRFVLYNNFLSLKGSMGFVPVHAVEIIFTRNMPINELETSQMIKNLHGIASSETLLAQLPFVNDPQEEALAADKEFEKRDTE